MKNFLKTERVNLIPTAVCALLALAVMFLPEWSHWKGVTSVLFVIGSFYPMFFYIESGRNFCATCSQRFCEGDSVTMERQGRHKKIPVFYHQDCYDTERATNHLTEDSVYPESKNLMRALPFMSYK